MYADPRLGFRDGDGFRTVFFAGMSLCHFSVEDELERKFVAVALHQGGLATQEEMAEAFGIGVTTLRSWERRHERGGLKGLTEDGRGRPKKMDATLELAIRRLVEQGHSDQRIARRLGLSEKTVRNVLKRLALERPRHDAPDMPFEQQPEAVRDEEAADAAEAPEAGEAGGEDAPAAPGTEPRTPAGVGVPHRKRPQGDPTDAVPGDGARDDVRTAGLRLSPSKIARPPRRCRLAGRRPA